MMSEIKIIIYQEDEARKAFGRDPLENLAWYYRMQRIEKEEGHVSTVAVITMCAACTHETVCTVFSNSDGNFTYRYAWFCEVCAHTYCGNAYWYPDQYDQKMMQHVALCTNLILDEIRKQ